MENKEEVEARKKVIEAVNALAATNKIKWYSNHFGDRCADISISLIGLDGESKTATLRFLSTMPDGSASAVQFSDESVKVLGSKVKGETLAHLSVRPPRSSL